MGNQKKLMFIQRELFDKHPRSEGRKARDAGIKRAVDHADNVEPKWSDKAYEMLKKFMMNHNGPFQAEDVSTYATCMDFPPPPHLRAWGGVFVRAKKEGIIRQIGIKKVKRENSHCANAAVWVQILKPVI